MKKYIILFEFSAIIFLIHFAFSGIAIYGDGIDYWAYLPSVYFDRDIDFENQYRHIYTPANNNSFIPSKAPEVQKTRITSTGKTDNPHPPGTAIVWTPAFILADFVSAVFGLPRNGYADLYQTAAGLWSIAFVVFGLFLNELIALKLTKDPKASSLSVIGIFLATPLLYYGSYDVLTSHFASFTLVSLFWYVLLFFKLNWKSALTIGVITGLATLVRLQEALLLIPAALFLFWHNRQKFLPHFSIILFTFILFLVPAVLVSMYLSGTFYPETYTKFWQVSLSLGSLFHPTNGLFTRTPLLLMCLFGIKKFAESHKQIFWLMAIYFLMQFILITFHGGWNAAAYGGRMYISTLPLFTILLAYTLKIIKEKWNTKYALYSVILFSVLNMISITSFVLFEKEVNSGRKRGLEEQTQQKLEKIFNRKF